MLYKMLDEYKKIYKESADLLVPSWVNTNKNQLVRDAIENIDSPKYNGYISAIMLKYWNKMCSYYYKCKLVITPEDAHSWLVQAVMYAIENHPWTVESSSIYNDKNGPDKVINRVIESKRLTFYQQLNRYNRKINSAILSLDTLSEDYLDAYTPAHYDECNVDLDKLVVKYFEDKDYFYCFLIDAVAYENYTISEHSKKLVTYLKSLNDDRCKIFANRYSLDVDKVIRASTYITRLPRSKLKSKILTTKERLRKILPRYLNANRTS